MNGLLLLFIEFFKIGLFSVGGGMATLPFLYRLADKYTWFSVNQIPDMIAISESTPGPLGVNMATYTGFQFGGALGSVCATLGLIFPSVVIIVIISKFLEKFRNNKYVEYAFYGLRPASTGLIAAAGLSVVVSNLFFFEGFLSLEIINWKGWILAVVLWVLTNKIKRTKGLHPILFILASAVVGVAFSM